MVSFLPNRQTLIAFKFGEYAFDIRWYAFLILLGAFVAYFVIKRDFKKAKYTDIEFLDTLFVYVLWAGIIGSRLWFCLFYNLDYYLSNPQAIIRIWDGGLAIQGGLMGGVLFAYVYCRKHGYPLMKILDIFMPNVLIGQAFGRWGNFVNQECHGPEVSEEYFNGILSFIKEGMYIKGHYYMPMFFYESTLCILGWFIIHEILKRKQNRRGDLTFAYLMWYGVIRFFIEAKRTDSLYWGNIKIAQLLSVVFVIIGLLGYFGLFSKLINSRKPTIVFDFDGTLCDTRQAILGAFEECFIKYSDISKFTDEVKSEVIGPALKDMFAKYFPAYAFDEVYKTYKDKQKEIMYKVTRPTEHTEQVVRQLYEKGYKLGIISTRSQEGIDEILKAFGLREYFGDICGLTDVEKIKPDPEGLIKLTNKNKWNKDLVMVGDSLMDIECGKNYGAYTVGYISDAKRSDQLAKAADETISDMADLLPILEKNISFTFEKL